MQVNASKEVELLENSQVKLTIHVPTADVKQEYDSIVKEYCEKAQLKGFRKGKVPAEVIIRKLGPSLVDQTRAEVLEKSLSEVCLLRLDLRGRVRDRLVVHAL